MWKIGIILALLTLTSCSAQNWYKGAQNAQTEQCMQGPLSEFQDCNRRSHESYLEYKQQLDVLKETNTKVK